MISWFIAALMYIQLSQASSYFNPLKVGKRVTAQIYLGPNSLVKMSDPNHIRLVKGAVFLQNGSFIVDTRDGSVKVNASAILKLNEELTVFSLKATSELLEFNSLPVPEGYVVRLAAERDSIGRPRPIGIEELQSLKKEMGLPFTKQDQQLVRDSHHFDKAVSRAMASQEKEVREARLAKERAQQKIDQKIRSRFRKKAGLDL